MARYAYTAIDGAGKEIRGLLDANTEKEAISVLGRQGLFPTEVHKAGITDGIRQELRDRLESDRQRREHDAKRKQDEYRRRHPRQRLVVRFLDGKVAYGVSYHLNIQEPSFHLDCTDVGGASKEERLTVRFHDVKAIFFVRSFDGKFDKQIPKPEIEANGPEIVVEFSDGEMVRGQATGSIDTSAERFFLVPNDEDGNNYNILVERANCAGVYTPAEYDAKKRREHEEMKSEGSGTLSQEETMGDFYFETRNYEAALKQYEAADKAGHSSRRLQKKLIVSKYNIGMGFIRRRQYPAALKVMEEILQIDPRNEHAYKKAKKLKKVIEKMEKGESDDDFE